MRRGHLLSRLDVQFYRPEHFQLEDRIRNAGYPVHCVGDPEISLNVVDGPFGSDLKVDEYVEQGVPLLRVSNCRTGEIVEDAELVYITSEKHQELIRSEVLPGDVLLTKAGHILGYTAVFPEHLERGNITSHLASIRPSKQVDPKFLALYLTSRLGIRQIYRWGNKATRPELNTDEVRKLLVPLPPLEIQQAFVEEMNAAREARKRKLAKTDELLGGLDGWLLEQLGLTPPLADERKVFAVRLGDQQGRFDAQFHLPRFQRILQTIEKTKRYPLGSLISFSHEIWSSQEALKREETTFRYIEISSVSRQTGEAVAEEVKVTEAPSRARMLVREGDIIVSLTRPHHGSIAQIDSSLDSCVASTGFAVIRSCDQRLVTSDYLWAILRTQLCLQQMMQRSSGGNYPAITEDELGKILVPVPGVEEQKAIVAEVHRRRIEVRRLRAEAEAEWQATKQRFEEQLLSGSAP